MKQFYGTAIILADFDGEGYTYITPVVGDTMEEMAADIWKSYNDNELLEVGIYNVQDCEGGIGLRNENYRTVNPAEVIEIIEKHQRELKKELQEYVNKCNERKVG